MGKPSLALMLLASACGGRALPRVDGGVAVFATPACGAATDSFTLQVARKVDVLFVVDNSETMAGEQDRLQGHFDAMIDALAAVPGGFPDSHIGVISTDLGTGTFETEWCETRGGDAGRLQGESCAEYSGAFIEVAGTGSTLSGNVADVEPAGIGVGDVQRAFRCAASLGTGGCRFEQPLEAMRQALVCDEGGCANPAFLRPDSLLVVVLLTDEDDCSASDPSLFDPEQNTASAPLGYFSSFRCFEFGMACDQQIARVGTQTLTGCAPDGNSAYLYPVERYREFLSTLRSQGRILLSAITGPFRAGDDVRTAQTGGGPIVDASCVGEGRSSAIPAIRIHDLVRRFGADGIVLSDQDDTGICGADFSPALQRIGDAIRGRVSPGCLSRPLVSPDGDGDPQPVMSPEDASCAVTETTANRTDNRARCEFASGAPQACPAAGYSPGPLAASSGVPCWYVCDAGAPEAGGCAYRWEMRLCRDEMCREVVPESGETQITADCLTCNPSELCGDGDCQPSLGESDSQCPEDCP